MQDSVPVLLFAQRASAYRTARVTSKRCWCLSAPSPVDLAAIKPSVGEVLEIVKISLAVVAGVGGRGGFQARSWRQPYQPVPHHAGRC